jgi:hypothetical protein
MLVHFSVRSKQDLEKANVYTDEDHWSNDAYKCIRIKYIVYEIDSKIQLANNSTN